MAQNYREFTCLSRKQLDAFGWIEERVGRHLLDFFGTEDVPITVYSRGRDVSTYGNVVAAWLGMEERPYTDVAGGLMDVDGDRVTGVDYNLCKGSMVLVIDDVHSEGRFRTIARAFESVWEPQDLKGFAYAWLSPVDERPMEHFYGTGDLRDGLTRSQNSSED